MGKIVCCMSVLLVLSLNRSLTAGQTDIPLAPVVAGSMTSQIGGPVIVSQTTQQLSQTVSNYPGYAMQQMQVPVLGGVCSSIGIGANIGANIGIGELELRPIVLKLLYRRLKNRDRSLGKTVLNQTTRTRFRSR